MCCWLCSSLICPTSHKGINPTHTNTSIELQFQAQQGSFLLSHTQHRITINPEVQTGKDLLAPYCGMGSKESNGTDDWSFDKNLICDGLDILLLPSICWNFMLFATHFERFPADTSGLESALSCLRGSSYREFSHAHHQLNTGPRQLPASTVKPGASARTKQGWVQSKGRSQFILFKQKEGSVSFSHSPHSFIPYPAVSGQPPPPQIHLNLRKGS